MFFTSGRFVSSCFVLGRFVPNDVIFLSFLLFPSYFPLFSLPPFHIFTQMALAEIDSPTECRKTGRRMTERRMTERRMTERRMTER
jgi:hypothetical protein